MLLVLESAAKDPVRRYGTLLHTVHSPNSQLIWRQVTHIVVNRNTGKTEYERVLQRTRCFMQHRKVPKSTQLKVQRFYDYVWSSGQFHILDESEVLRLLPTEMKTELALKGNLIALEKVSLFQGCDSGLLRDLVLKLKHQMYSPGDYVCRSGDLGREMFIVSTGKLQVISSSEEEIRTIGEGAIFGEISVLNLNRGSRRTTDVISKGYSELFILTNTDVLDTLQNYPRARDIISQQSRRRLQEQLNRVRSFDGSDAGFPSRRGSSRVYRDPFPGRSRKSSARLRKISRTSSNQSRDSGFMSTSGHSTLSSAPSGRISMSPMVEEVTTDMTERLQNIYEQNTRALKSSLEHVLDHEVKYLRQRLHDTEMERDCKQREISQLKNQIGKLRHPDRDHVSDEKHETNTGED
uniref:Cyclic nucleotide-gated cation channel-like n=1 Tax=Saccoglossus kowalevskii TaxID=10224 RepID=A0ABM0H1W2_SACKO|nr:PREDICTED: cyclic nucleotide-gated cation channel-like [Saccoglossus kowalevskii]